MFRAIVAAVFAFVATFAAMYAINPAYFDGHIPTMEDGSYTAYHVHKAFDVHTGEPVYWVVGGKGRKTYFTDTKVEAYIEPREIKLFIIPRSKLAGVPDTVPGAPNFHTLWIDIAQGNGRVVE
jgi:hypothetical protein